MLKKMDKKMLKMFGIIIGIVVVLFTIIIIVLTIIGSKKTYSQVEDMMINSAKRYYNKNNDALPSNDNETSIISSDKLIDEGYIKSFDKLLDDPTCSGQVNVTKSGNSYLYNSTLNCGENYTTKKLKDVIIEKVVESKDGLYKYDNYYIFRGENVNNYVSYLNKTWRIIRINEDGSIRMIDTTKRDSVVWDDRYNSDKEYNTGINNYEVSRVKEMLDEILKFYDDDELKYMLKQNVCIGKRDENETDNSGNVECSKTLDNQYFDLIRPNEFALASLSELCKNPTKPECSNYNYLADLQNTWTAIADKNSTYKAYKLSSNIELVTTTSSAQPKIVININPNVNYVDGDGSEENPYTFR